MVISSSQVVGEELAIATYNLKRKVDSWFLAKIDNDINVDGVDEEWRLLEVLILLREEDEEPTSKEVDDTF